MPSAESRSPIPPVTWLLLLGAIILGTPFVPVASAFTAQAAVVALTALYVGAAVAFALSVARYRFPVAAAVAWLAVAAAAWGAALYAQNHVVGPAMQELKNQGAALTMRQMLASLYVTALRDLALVSGAVFVGVLVARLIKYPNLIGPIGAMVALIDIWGVLFGGIVSQLMTNKATAQVAAKAMTSGPKIGDFSAAPPAFSLSIPSIGMGDFLFISLLLAALVNLGMNWRTAAWLMGGFCTVALCSIAFTWQVPVPAGWPPSHMAWVSIEALPGLLFIGAGAILPNWKFFRFTREEKFALLYAGIFVVILSAGMYIGFTRALAERTPDAPPRPTDNGKTV